MSEEINRFGLKRPIPSAVAREVRQRCGFGCVICGRALYDYDHIDPEFADADEHRAAGIVLLCHEHHTARGRKFLSKETVLKHASSPKCRQQGFSFGEFDVGTDHPQVIFGTLTADLAKSLLTIDGESLLSIAPPEEPDGPFRISARLIGRNGLDLLRIQNNQWITKSDSWDVEVVGGVIKVRNGLGDIALILRSEPPKRIVIERLHLVYHGVQVRCREGEPTAILLPGGAEYQFQKLEIFNRDIVVCVEGRNICIGKGGSPQNSASMAFAMNPSKSIFPPFIINKNTRRLDLCPCGSLLWFKRCHGQGN